MPTYEYACRDCGQHVEVVQSFRDDPLTECAGCGGRLRKVYGATGIIFKGSGYYVTDSRTKAKPAGTEKTGEAAKTGEGSTGEGAKKSPAADPAKPSTPTGSGDQPAKSA